MVICLYLTMQDVKIVFGLCKTCIYMVGKVWYTMCVLEGRGESLPRRTEARASLSDSPATPFPAARAGGQQSPFPAINLENRIA